jgi:bacillithiol biosynthesis cysteine-adding enzyme BshC
MECTRIGYAATRRFTRLVEEHAGGDAFLDAFRSFPPTLDGLRAAAQQRSFPAASRTVLVEALRRQYRESEPMAAVERNLALLARPDALAVTTGHQLCLFTGPLYVPFKLLNAIRLARTLSDDLGRPVVPVFWMATEDHDRAEIDHAWLGERQVHWPGAAAGAVGRLPLEGIAPVVEQACTLLGSGSEAEALGRLLRECYQPGRTLADATRRFVHALFGRFGLLILDGDDPALKALFAPVMREELLNGITEQAVRYANERLAVRHAVQAHARPINLFHLRPGHRARIERDGDGYQVLHGGPRFDLDGLLAELEQHPERFSPNVLMRPLYQETILPGIAYIGGGGELAYWMQLKWLFQAVRLPMPAVLLRTSAAFLTAKHDRQRRELGLALEDLFLPAHALMDRVAHAASGRSSALPQERALLASLSASIRARATAIDPTLGPSIDAAAVRMQRILAQAEARMARALRRREAVHLGRVQAMLDALFPGGGLQERRHGILPMLAASGPGALDALLDALDPLDARFTMVVDG